MFSNIDLIVEVHYTDNLRSRFVPSNVAPPELEKEFRKHIQDFGIPPPKRDNISISAPGVMRTHWNVPEHSVLHHSLSNRFKGAGKSRIIDNLHRLSIKRVDLIELKADCELPFITSVFPETGPNSGLNPPVFLEYSRDLSAPGPSSNRFHQFGQLSTQTSNGATNYDRIFKFGGPNSQSLLDRVQPAMDASPEDWSHADNSYPEDGSWDDQDSFYEYARFEMDKDEAASRTSSQRTRWSESSVEHMLGKHPMSRSPSHERDPVKRFKRTDSVGSNFSKPTLESLGSTNQDLVRQLKMEQEKNKVLAQELQELRRKNAEQEALLSEIRDECRTPFVVPSLLDAFMAVSKMTTAATIDSVH